MSIEFACKNCDRLLRVPGGSGGKSCECPSCGTLLDIPKPTAVAATVMDNATGLQRLQIPCPQCHFELVCSPNLLGTRGQCRNCKTIFTIVESPTEASRSEGTAPSGWVFNCPKCDQLFEGNPEMDGLKGKCHACGEVFAIDIKPATPPSPAPIKTNSPPDKPKGQVADPKPSSPKIKQLPPDPAFRASGANSQTKKAQTSSHRMAKNPTTKSFQFACSGCQGVMEVPSSAAGQTTACPFCRKLLAIPSSSRTRESTFPATNDIWADLGDMTAAAANNPYSAPTHQHSTSPWDTPQSRGNVRGLTFGNAFTLTFNSLLPSCLMAPAVFLGIAIIGALGVFVAQLIGVSLFKALEVEPATTAAYVVIFTPLILVGIGLLLLANAALCMTCNTALQAVRGKTTDAKILFGTGGAYGGMLVLMIGWTVLNVVRQFGIPYAVREMTQAGEPGAATVPILAATLVVALLQYVLYLMLASVPFALIDGENFSGAIGTSTSIFCGNAGTIAAISICGGLLYTLVSVLSCGIGFFVLIGSMFYLNASIYRLAMK